MISVIILVGCERTKLLKILKANHNGIIGGNTSNSDVKELSY